MNFYIVDRVKDTFRYVIKSLSDEGETNSPKPVSCPNCTTGVDPKPNLGKNPKNISLEDIAPRLHKHEHVLSDNGAAAAKKRAALATHPKEVERAARDAKKRSISHLNEQEKFSHLEQGNPFKHLSDEEKAALHHHTQRISKYRFSQAADILGMPRIENGFQVEDHLPEYSEKVIRELGPHIDEETKRYHQGIDTEGIKTGKDLHKEIAGKARSWPFRELFKKYGDKLGDEATVEKRFKLEKQIRDHQARIDAMHRESGEVSGRKTIDKNTPYGLHDLENIAGQYGLRFEKEFSPDGNIKGVSVYDKDGDNEEIAHFDQPMDEKGAVDKLRDKLAGIVNPKENKEESPIAKYKKLIDEHGNENESIERLQKDHDEALKKYEAENENPDVHIERAINSNIPAIEAFKEIETASPNESNKLKDVRNSLESLNSLLANGDTDTAIKECKKIISSVKLMDLPDELVQNFVHKIYHSEREINEAKRKSTIPENTRDLQLGKMFDSIADKKDILESKKLENENRKLAIEAMHEHPTIKEYKSLLDKIKENKEKLNALGGRINRYSTESLNKVDDEGEEYGDASDKSQLEKWERENAGESPEESYIDVPDDFDINNPDENKKTGSKFVDALSGNNNGGDLIFGSLDKDNSKGLVHVTKKLLKDTRDNPEADNFMHNIMKDVYEGKTPDMFASHSHLANRTVLKNLFGKIMDKDGNVNPRDLQTLKKYALMFSNYDPVPYDGKDLANNVEDKFKPLLDIIHRGASSTFNPKVIENSYYRPLQIIGNQMVKKLNENDPDKKKIFDKVEELNRAYDRPSKEDGKRTHGASTLRRQLGRKFDYIAAKHYGDINSIPWHHNVEDNQDYMNKIRSKANQKYKKSFVIYY